MVSTSTIGADSRQSWGPHLTSRRRDRPAIPELGAIFESVGLELPCCGRPARVPCPPNLDRHRYGIGMVTCLACGLASFYDVTPEWGPDEAIHVAGVLVSDCRGK